MYGYDDLYHSAAASISDDEFTDAFALAAERGVGIEITLGFLPRGEDGYGEIDASIETPLRYLNLAKQAGCKFTLGSDAHSLKKIQ